MSANKPVELLLAPMEGVTDHVMRDLLTELGGIDLCITEFIRVCDVLLPDSVFHRISPELKNNAQTRSGIQTNIQLLGSNAEAMTENALKAIRLGAKGIDLNFGCPAKTVNKNDGGAALLKSSSRIHTIVKTIRQNIPEHIPVSAKIRLGYDDKSACIENAVAITEAGASWLTVHCRTKIDGYKPPAYWEWIPKIKDHTPIKIIANGEIWSVDDFKRCKDITGCNSFMIGRPIMRNPFLFRQIKELTTPLLIPTPAAEDLVFKFFNLCLKHARTENYAVSRTKQWLAQLRHVSMNWAELFEAVKTVSDVDVFTQALIKYKEHNKGDFNG